MRDAQVAGVSVKPNHRLREVWGLVGVALGVQRRGIPIAGTQGSASRVGGLNWFLPVFALF